MFVDVLTVTTKECQYRRAGMLHSTQSDDIKTPKTVFTEGG